MTLHLSGCHSNKSNSTAQGQCFLTTFTPAHKKSMSVRGTVRVKKESGSQRMNEVTFIDHGADAKYGQNNAKNVP